MAEDPVEVVLVEDNPADVELVLNSLAWHQLTTSVRVLRDGVEALDYFFGRGTEAAQSAEETPRLILLDLKLPKVGGLEVIQALKGDPRTRRIPIVVFTSSSEPQDLSRSYDLGANGYLVKPVDFAQLSELIRLLGAYWLRVNRCAPL